MPTSTLDASLSIGDICEETGLSADVIRVWERRYGFPVPVRLPSGHRRYRPGDLNRLRLLAECAAAGHRPSALMRLDDEALRGLLLRDPEGGADPLMADLMAGVGAMDSDRIRALLHRALEARGLRPFLATVVAPLLDRVGLAWAEGTIGVQHEHLLSELLEDMLRGLRAQIPVRRDRGAVVLATLPGERHRLGLLMVGLIYADQGIRVEMLGVDTPVAAIARAARTLQATRVAVSLSIQSSGEPTRRLLMDLLERLPPGCTLVVGGQGAARTRRIDGVERITDLETL